VKLEPEFIGNSRFLANWLSIDIWRIKPLTSAETGGLPTCLDFNARIGRMRFDANLSEWLV
jgi:hypothetical protein